MAITYDAPSDTITVTGYTEGTPCTFTDIYNADQAGGWGQVSLQGTNQFLFNCSIIIGDGSTSTYFADTNKQVELNINVYTSGTGKFIHVKNNGSFQLGVLVSENTHSTNSGCSLLGLQQNAFFYMIYGDSSATINLYSSSFSSTYSESIVGLFNSNNRMWNCVCFNRVGVGFQGSVGDYYNVQVFNNYKLWSSGGTMENIVLDTATDLFMRAWHYNYIFTNILAKNMGALQLVEKAANVGTLYFIDSNVESWKIKWYNSGAARIYRQYTFNLQVTEEDGTAIENATVTLYDKDDNEVFSVSTDASGLIAEQTVSRGYYDQANGDTLQDYGPFTLTVKKGGFQIYNQEGIVLDEPVDWRIALLDIVVAPAGVLGGQALTKSEYDTIVKKETKPYKMATTILLLQIQKTKQLHKNKMKLLKETLK